MKSRPIIFTGSMVRAILAGRKTQTRRIVRIDDTPVLYEDSANGKRQRGIPTNAVNVRFLGSYLKCDAPDGSTTVSSRVPCPYGAPGDELWVRETFNWSAKEHLLSTENARLCPERRGWSAPYVVWRADGEREHPKFGAALWRSPIHMPRWASRITLRITGVRVERVQAITPTDACAEGVFEDGRYATEPPLPYPVATFAAGWREIHGPESWDANPWVWVVAFERVKP